MLHTYKYFRSPDNVNILKILIDSVYPLGYFQVD